jgi:hypothetical protein
MLLGIKKNYVIFYFSVFFSVLLGECHVRDLTVAMVIRYIYNYLLFGFIY